MRTGDTHRRRPGPRSCGARRRSWSPRPESLYLLLTAARSRQRARHRRHGDRRRDPRPGPRQAGLPPRPLPRAAGPRRGGGQRGRAQRSACRPRSGPSRPSPASSSATGRPCQDRRLRPPPPALDLALELPDGELEAIMSGQQMGEVARPHRRARAGSTAPRWCSSTPGAWPSAWPTSWASGWATTSSPPTTGRLSKERRHRVEARLRAGDLRALVATASLELGIDIGPVELVCQIGSPRSLATFLQRVGRSGHSRAARPRAASSPHPRRAGRVRRPAGRACGRGRLDALDPPVAPLDILAQQLVAEARAPSVWRTSTSSSTWSAGPRPTPG